MRVGYNKPLDNAELQEAIDECERALIPFSPLTEEAERAAWTITKHYLSLLDQQRRKEEEDAKPADLPWLKSIGFTKHGGGYWRLDATGFPPIMYSAFAKFNVSPWLHFGTSAIIRDPTRGHVRKLCEALGIALKEAK